MGDDLTNKIKQVIDLLGQDNIMNTLSSFTGSKNTGNEVNSEKEDGSDELTQLPAEVPVNEFKKMHEHRINLLNSLHPFMSTARQKKLNNMVKVLNMAVLVGLFDKKDK